MASCKQIVSTNCQISECHMKIWAGSISPIALAGVTVGDGRDTHLWSLKRNFLGEKNPSCSAVYAVPSSGPFRSEWIFDPLNYHLAFGSHGHKRIKPQMVLEHWWSYLNLRVSRFGIWQYDLNLKYNDTCFGYLRKIMLFFLLSAKNGWPVEMRDCCTLLYVFLAYSQRSSSEECTAVFAAGGRSKY